MSGGGLVAAVAPWRRQGAQRLNVYAGAVRRRRQRVRVRMRRAWRLEHDLAGQAGQRSPLRLAVRRSGGQPLRLDHGEYDSVLHVRNPVWSLRTPAPRLPSRRVRSGGFRRRLALRHNAAARGRPDCSQSAHGRSPGRVPKWVRTRRQPTLARRKSCMPGRRTPLLDEFGQCAVIPIVRGPAPASAGRITGRLRRLPRSVMWTRTGFSGS